MSETSQGEGWWQASDGKWYPPEQHPSARGEEAGRSTESLPAAAASPAATAGPDSGSEPHVTFEVTGTLEMPHWRPLVQWAMAIPVAIMGIFVHIIGIFGFIVAWFAVLFTGKIPVSMHNLITLWLRFYMRLYTFVFGWTIVYPPLTVSPGANDDHAYDTVEVGLPELEAETSRLALIHWLMAIPHLIILYVLNIGVWIVGAISWFAVLFTGRYPAGLREFMIKVARYQLRIMAYVAMLYSTYPKFGL